MWGSSTSVVVRQIQRTMKEFKMIEIRCDKCNCLSSPRTTTLIDPSVKYQGDQELYHLCINCIKLFKLWCKQGVEK